MCKEIRSITYKKCMEMIFLAAIVFLTISYFGGYYLIITTIGMHSKLLERTAYVLLMCKIIGTRYRKKEFFCLAALAGSAIFGYQQSGNPEMLINLLVIAAMKDVDWRRLLKTSLYALIFSVILVGTCSLLGYGGPVEITQMYGRGDVETRYCFGFIHPNQWAHAMFMIMLLFALGTWEKMDIKRIALLIFWNFAVYYFAVSKTAFMVGILLAVLSAAFRYLPRMMWSRIMIAAELICTVCIWGISLLAVQSNAAGTFLVQNLNKIFTGRFGNAKDFCDYYGCSLWGMRIGDVHPETGEVLDIGYIRYLLEHGWGWFVLLFFAVLLFTYFAVKNRRGDLLTAVFCILFYAFSEAVSFMQIPANIIFYCLGMQFFKGQQSEKMIQRKNRSE